MSVKLASVAVENTVYHFDKSFSYRIPERFSSLRAGMRVAVPFSKANKRRQGMVLSVREEEGDFSTLKEISEVLDDEPVLSGEMIALCEFMKAHCFCTYYDAVRAILPAGIHYRLTYVYSVRKDLGDCIFDLPDEQRRIVSFILSKNNKTEEKKLLSEFGLEESDLLDEMYRDGILLKSDAHSRKIGDKTVRMIRLSPDAEEKAALKMLSEKQQSVYDTLSAVGAVSVKELCYYTGVTPAVADALVKKGIAEYFDDEVFRIPKTAVAEKKEIVLTEEQNKALIELEALLHTEKPEVSLLYGITGSGKTSVYFKLIEKVMGEGKGVIVMVPEIALTPQLISLFRAHFGEEVAVFHSALSIGERMDEYKRVKKGRAKIAVGTRSAVFAPFEDLGLLIMDEEQEHTYKSESKPRFHAREIAKFRCSYHRCLLLLSSATPSVETFYHAERGAYHMQTLTHRYGDAVLPEVTVADMNEEQARGNTSEFSEILRDAIGENLSHGKQSILLLNRRGYNTFVTCRSCKETISCPNCSISLTYHHANNRLMCHYCGYSMDYVSECPACHSRDLNFFGAGTQKAEVELSELFPDARILRMDTDTTMTRSSHEKKLSAFSKGEFDILVGTQMVAKGLDFENVTLVGVLNADRMLYLDDYRSYENTFSLLTQVVGRSGRGRQRGRAIIQTFTPENPIITLASRQDYLSFYRTEIEIRRGMLYPPFVTMCLVGFVSDDQKKAQGASRRFMTDMTELLKKEYPTLPMRALGPSEAALFKAAGKYRYKLILKCRNDKYFREMLSRLLCDFARHREYADVTVYADISPLSL